MTMYVFNEPGVIAGIPGTFAHCRVEVGEDGLPVILPLAAHPAFEAAEPDVVPLADKAEEETPATAIVVQEQAAPVTAFLRNNGG